jgi:hypothetical protein
MLLMFTGRTYPIGYYVYMSTKNQNNASRTTLFDLVVSMKSRKSVTVWCNATPYTGVVNGIQAEDGSGRSWNVTILQGNSSATVYFRE